MYGCAIRVGGKHLMVAGLSANYCSTYAHTHIVHPEIESRGGR